MNKRHYIAIAGILAGELACAYTEGEKKIVRNLTLSLADQFAQDNPRFNREVFYAAVGIE